MITAILLAVGAYLLGSVSTAIVVCNLAGLPDPRSQGSGNPGATNVLRIGNKGAAAATLAGDLLKGLLPIVIARLFTAEPWTLALVGLAAVLGHIFPVFFHFKGGKGVATALGVLLGISWPVAVAALATWLAVFAFTRTSSLSALVAALLSPVFMYMMEHPIAWFLLALLLTTLLVWRHSSNIEKLLAGREDKVGTPKL